VAGGVPGTYPLNAAGRGVDAWLREASSFPPGASLGPLLERVALSVREAGELHEQGRWVEVETQDGSGFTPDPSRIAMAYAVEAAFLRVSGGVASIATLGSCAVLLVRWGGLHALHPLDVLLLRGTHSSVCTRALGMDPRRPAVGVHEHTMACEPGDRFVLVSPTIAAAFHGYGVRPPETLKVEDTEALLDWLTSCIPPVHQGYRGKGVAAVLVLE
jgi:hypothetical protein